MPAPEDIRVGALPRDPACHWCPHPVHLLACSDTCDCTHAEQLGIDTALGG